MRTSILLMLVAGCATPNKYYPSPDAGGEERADAALSPDAPKVGDDAPAPDGPAMPSPDATAVDVSVGPGSSADSNPRDTSLDEGVRDAPVDERLPADLSLPTDPAPAACTKCTNETCVVNRWDFDSGSLQGAKSGGSFAASPAIAMAPPYQGSQSLGMSVPVDFTGIGAGGSSYVSFPLCSGTNSANLRSKTFRARVYLENGSQPATMPFNLQLYTEDMVEAIVNTFHAPGSWVLLEGTLPAAEDANVTELQLWFGSATNPSWKGTVWVDDVRIE